MSSLKAIRMLSVRDGCQGNDIDSETIPDIISNFTFYSGDFYSDQYLRKTPNGNITVVHPKGFILNGDAFLSPIDINDHYFRDAGTSVYGAIHTYKGINCPYISQDYYDISYNLVHGDSMAFYFWNPATSSYSSVTLSYSQRTDGVSNYVAPAVSGYPAISASANPCFVASQGSHTPTGMGYSLMEYADLKFIGGNVTWPFANLDTTGNTYQLDINGNYIRQGNVSTQVQSEGIHYAGKYCKSPFASVMVSKEYDSNTNTFTGINKNSTGRIYPVVSNIRRNFDDPQKRWCATLLLCVAGKPAGTPYFGCGSYDLTSFSNITQVIRCGVVGASVRVERDVPLIYIPESYGPFGNWTILLEDDFGMADTTYLTNPYEIDESLNVVFEEV